MPGLSAWHSLYADEGGELLIARYFSFCTVSAIAEQNIGNKMSLLSLMQKNQIIPQ